MSQRLFWLLLLPLILVNASGMMCDVFMMDSSLYACLSKNICITNNWLTLSINNTDWLDKPHFPFWICALSMKVFGFSTFAYKLPSFLFFLVALLYTFKLSKLLYNKQTAYLACLILGSSLHLVVSNNDVRAEAILVGLVMFTSYYVYKLSRHFSIKSLLFCALGGAAAVMTKGVFVLIIFYSGVFVNLLVRREYTSIFKLRWLFAFVLTFIFILPELYALYQQFDLHPEKTVFGQRGISGVQFFLWDSQFGRFFNIGPIKGRGDMSFFVHTMLWAFAPWAIMGVTSIILAIRRLFGKQPNGEYLSLSSFLVMFIVFSVSQFQLPHYTNIIFPFLAILVATTIHNYASPLVHNVLKYSIFIYAAVQIVIIGLLEYYFQPQSMYPGIVATGLILVQCLTVAIIRIPHIQKHVVLGVISSLTFCLYLNLSFYPSLLQYQSGSQIAFHINKQYAHRTVYSTYTDYTLQYYLNASVNPIHSVTDLQQTHLPAHSIIIADSTFQNQLAAVHIPHRSLRVFNSYCITRLVPSFLNKSTRSAELEQVILIELIP